jgi:hypothetical protein
MQFGRWTVIEERQPRSRVVLCRCECGTEKLVPTSNLTRGQSTNCGCHKGRVLGERSRTHGTGYEDYRYRLWQSIKGKCLRPSQKDYRYYGGRGIRMHEAWVNDFPAFAAYLDEALGIRPEGYSLDRVDNDGHYEPGNLRWATRREQTLNRRVWVWPTE